LKKLRELFNVLRSKFEAGIDVVERKPGATVFVLISAYAVVFSGFTIFMHYAFKTYAWDLGIFTQSLWTTVNRGKLFYYTIELSVNPSGSFLGAHFSPILFLILPVYAVFQSPCTLLVLQSMVLALGALPVYWIATKQLGDKLSAVGIAAAYLIYPALQSVNCFDFHTEAFIPLFFLLTFHYIEEKKWFKGLLFALLTLSTIEFAPILVMFLGVYLVLREITKRNPTQHNRSLLRRIAFPFILMIIAIVWFFGAFYVMNTVNPIKGTGLPGNWTFWGSSLSEALVNIITHPLEALTFMVSPIGKIFYVFSLLAPLLMLPLFSVEFLIALPWLIAAPLSEYWLYYNFYFQYSAFAIGQLFVAAIFSLRKLSSFSNDGQRNFKLQRTIIASILAACILLSVAMSPIGLPILGDRRVEMTPHSNLLLEVLNLVPDNASVATQNDIFAHVAQREDAYILTWPMPMDVDYILVDLKSSHFLTRAGFSSTASPVEALEKEIGSGKYGLFASADGILLFKNRYSGLPTLFRGRIDAFDSDQLLPMFKNSKVLNDPTSYSGRVIAHEANDSTGFAWYGPYSYFFTGEYRATFRVKTNSAGLDCILDVAASGNVVSQRVLSSFDFKTLGDWEEFTLDFRISGLPRMEFRGYCESNNTYVALDYVRVIQIGM
jgi:uncharacterized membrane protein